MLEIQNNFHKRATKKKLTKNNLVKRNCAIAAEYLSKKFVYSYSLKDPNNDTSKHLKKIFMHFLRYNVQNVDLIKVISKNKVKSIEFRVNILNNSDKIKKIYNKKNIISVNKFFNNNMKYIFI